MFLEWYQLCVLIVVFYLYIDWYSTKRYNIGYHQGTKDGNEKMLEILVTNKFLKVVDPTSAEIVFEAWPTDLLHPLQK